MSQDEVAMSAADMIVQEDARIDRYLLCAKLVLATLVFGLGGWAALTEINGAVVAPGKVAVEANSKSVQHLEGGIVTRIVVREGQLVTQDQLLLQLDPAQANEKIKGLRSQARAKRDQLGLLKSELADLKALEAKRLVPRSQLAKIQRDYAELEGEHGRLVSELKRLSTSRRRLEVRSPIAGRVHALQVHTVGGVVAPGQEILKIVPSGASLIVEGAIQPQDIDQVVRGQAVSIRVTSFNQRTTPELNGQIINVSADLLTDERKETYHYLVQIALNEGELQRLGQKTLVPGMPADVFIRTEARTVLDYLLAPLTDQFRRAMREQ